MTDRKYKYRWVPDGHGWLDLRDIARDVNMGSAYPEPGYPTRRRRADWYDGSIFYDASSLAEAMNNLLTHFRIDQSEVEPWKAS